MSVNFDPKKTVKIPSNLGVKGKKIINNSLNRIKELTHDTVQLKKAGKYTAFGLLGAGAVVAIVNAVKSFIETKKENNLLKDFVLNQREFINDLKNHIGIQKEIIEAKDAVIDAKDKIASEAV